MLTRPLPVLWLLASMFLASCGDPEKGSSGAQRAPTNQSGQGAAADSGPASQSDPGAPGNQANPSGSGEAASQDPDLPPIDPAKPAILEVVFTIGDSGQPAAMVPYEIVWETEGEFATTTSNTLEDGIRRSELEHGSRLKGIRVSPTAYTAPIEYPENVLLLGGRVHRFERQLPPAGIVSGVVLDLEGNPVPDAVIGVIFQDPTELDKQLEVKADVHSTSDDQGRFRIGGLPSGPFTVEASTPTLMSVRRPGGIMRGAQEYRGLEIHMEPGHEVYGQVWDEQEQPVAEVLVIAGKPGRRVYRKETAYPDVYMYGPRACLALSQEDGQFQLAPVPESQAWNVQARHPLYRLSRAHLEPGQQDLWIEMTVGPHLAGNLIHSNGNAAGVTQVHLLSPAGVQSMVTETDGSFLFSLSEELEEVWVLAFHERGGLVFHGPISVGVGTEPLTLTMEHALSISGVVVDAQGQALSGVPVRIRGTAPPGFLEAHLPERFLQLDASLTGVDGSFQFPYLYPGQFTVEVRPMGGEAKVLPGIEAGGDALRIELP